MTLVVDASIAAKWVLPEDGDDRAAALRGEPDELIAPSLIAAEVGNAVRKRVVAKELTAAEAVSAVEIATGLIDRLVPIPELAVRALELAIDLRHPIYDCFYLALAERENTKCVTADERLIAVAKKAKIKVKAL
ncbi:MAG: type II toxin-antitoxin system VapC family toxin [Xanthobacteraceae bacterium]